VVAASGIFYFRIFLGKWLVKAKKSQFELRISGLSQQNCCKWLVEAKSVSTFAETSQQISVKTQPLSQQVEAKSADCISSGWLSPNLPQYITSGAPRSTLSGIHFKENRGNAALCDGHVESRRESEWSAETGEARKRWNNDNLPHPETWQ
jgi:prepilin-type processing-associated H-X9-DG protein